MKKLTKIILLVLCLCLAAAFAACGMGGKDDNTRLYVPGGDAGEYQEIEPMQETENQNGGDLQGETNQNAQNETNMQSETDENTQNENKDAQNSSATTRTNRSGEKSEVGRFDLKSFKAGGAEIKDSFEYFYIQLRADDVLIAAFKQKDKKDAYGMSGYKLENEKIIIDNLLSTALKDITIEYKGEEIMLSSAGKNIQSTFARSDSK